MKRTMKRLLALLLAMAMSLSLVSANVWAAEVEPSEDGSVSAQSEEETVETAEESAASDQDEEAASSEEEEVEEPPAVEEDAEKEEESSEEEESPAPEESEPEEESEAAEPDDEQKIEKQLSMDEREESEVEPSTPQQSIPDGIDSDNDDELSESGKEQESLQVMAASSAWAWPTSNHTLKSDWPCYSGGSYHGGTDFPIASNSPVYSTCYGQVVSVQSLTTSYGKHIKIKATVNGATVYMRYCHLNGFSVSVGDIVRAGQKIGISGSTGNSTGPHLHYEVRDSNDRYGNASSPNLNPRNYLPGTSYTFQDGESCNCSTSYAGTYTCTSQSTLLIRSGHGTNYGSIGSIPGGAAVTVTKADGSWAHVEYNGLKGYSSMQYLKKNEPTPDPVPKGSEMTSGYNRTLPDGDYLIVNAGTTDKTSFYYLDIVGTAQPADGGTNVALHGPLGGKDEIPTHELWTLSYDGGFYTIKQKGTNMALDVYNADTARGANVQMWQSNTSSAQKWAISTNDKDGYRLQAKCSGFSLDLADAKVASGTNVQQWTNNDTTAQSWLFIPYKPAQPIANGRYVLISAVADDLELDVAGDSGDIAENTNVQIWHDTAPSRYNSFDITKLGNGYYKIIHAASGKSLDVSGGVSKNGTNIAVHTANDSLAQQWAITEAGNGYVLRARCSGYALDLDNGGTTNGTKVLQWPYYGYSPQKNQIWKFVPAEYTVSYNANGGSKAPSNQIKYYKEKLTLTSSKPERANYNFKGWNTKADGTGTAYSPGGTYSADANVPLYAQWEKIPAVPTTKTVADGHYHIVSKINDFTTVTVGGPTKNEGGNIQMWKSIYADNESFDVAYLNNGYYKITSSYSGMALTAENDSLNDSNVVQRSYKGTDNQQWAILDVSDGIYYEIAPKSNLAVRLDSKDGSAENGANNIVHSSNGGKSQRWCFAAWIPNATVTLSQTTYDYDGTAKQPDITVQYAGKTLIKGTDYTVTYSSNVDAGTASVKITGKTPRASGETTKTFTIRKICTLDLNGWLDKQSVNNIQGYGTADVYINGNRVADDVSDYWAQFAYGSKYEIKDIKALDGCIYKGVHSGSLTGTLTDYANKTVVELEFIKDNSKSLEQCQITLAQTEYEYDGTAKQPTVTVKDGEKTLTRGTDYELTYKDNVEVGTATVTITGKGSYTDSVNKTFTISAAPNPDPNPDDADCVFTVGNVTATKGSEITVPVSITKNSGIAGFALDIDYDHSVLALTKATAAAELGGTFTRHEDTVTWFTDDNTTLTGTAFNLTFTVAADTSDGETDVCLAMHEGKPNVTDENSDNVVTAFVKGTVTIRSYTPGDVTGDNDVTIADVVKVNRHVVGKIVLTAAEKLAGDVTGDKDVTIADVVKINRFVVGKIKSLSVNNNLTTQAVGEATITVGSVNVKPGEQTAIPVTLSGNPGIAGMALEFTIPEGMTLESITKGEVFKTGTFTPNGNAFTWYTTDNITENGVILNLNVTAPQIPGEYAIKASLKEGKASNLTDENSDNVGASFTNGKLTVEEKAAPHTHIWDDGTITTPATCQSEGVKTFTCTVCGQTKTEVIPRLMEPQHGDFDGDNDVAMADVILGNQVVVGLIHLTEEQKKAADVTGDDDYTMVDVVRMNRFVLGKIETL